MYLKGKSSREREREREKRERASLEVGIARVGKDKKMYQTTRGAPLCVYGTCIPIPLYVCFFAF